MTDHRITLKLDNEPNELKRLKKELTTFCERAGLSDKDTFQVNLAVEELFVNIVSYGYQDQALHQIIVTLALEDEFMVISFQDDAKPFNPLELAEPDLKCPIEKSKVGGLGVHLVRRLCDEVQYERGDGFNRLTIKKALSNPGGCRSPECSSRDN